MSTLDAKPVSNARSAQTFASQSSRLAQDFSRIPLHAPAAVAAHDITIANELYDDQVKPTSTPLNADDRKTLQATLDGLKTADAALYKQLQADAVVLANGTLNPKNNKPSTLTYGISLATPKATDSGIEYDCVIVLDVSALAKAKAMYERSREGASTQDMLEYGKPQSALETLRHEAGHLVFARMFGFDEQGKQRKGEQLAPALKKKIQDNTSDASIETDMRALSEFAAEGTEQRFDEAAFKEENDPRFGLTGFRDLEGNVQSPSGFGACMKRGITLVEAKTLGGKLSAKGAAPILLKPWVIGESRLFDLFILIAANKENVRKEFESLKEHAPDLGHYKIASYNEE